MVAMYFFAASFFKSVLLKFAEKSDGERVNELNYIHVLLLMLTIHIWPFYMN